MTPNKHFNIYKEGLNLEFFDDRSGKRLPVGVLYGHGNNETTSRDGALQWN